MGIDYSFDLCFGYKVDYEDVVDALATVKHTKTDGVFHMEDRFDPRTGQKLKQVKVWDVKPIDKEERHINFGDVNFHIFDDPNILEKELSKKFGCNIDIFKDNCSCEWNYIFFRLDKCLSYKDATDYYRITLYKKEITYSEIQELMPKAIELKSKLVEAGMNPGDLIISIGERVS